MIAATDEDQDRRVVENQGLVCQVARKFRGRGVDFEDLVQFGNLGLIRAAGLYDPARGFRFSTYATYWVRQTILRGIAATGGTIRVPPHARHEAALYRRAAGDLAVTLGREAQFDEVMSALGVAPRQWPRFRAVAATLHFRHDPGPLVGVAVGHDGGTILVALCTAEHREQFALAFARLPPEQGLVLALRYGLDGNDPLDVRATSLRVGRSRRHVVEAERRALAALKVFLRR